MDLAAPTKSFRSRAAALTGTEGSYLRWFPVSLGAVMGLLYTLYSLVRHGKAQTAGYDLGIFSQAVSAYAQLRAPIVPIKGPGFNLLGDHFHPILVVLAPFYRLWPDVRVLLLAQSVLMALSIIPIGRLALRRLGPVPGTVVTVAYALSWGLQGLISYDFHEVAFAVPVIAMAMCALAEERWRAAVGWTLLLLLIKEDLGITVAAVGCYLCLRRQWRLGLAVIATGVAGMALVLFVLIPALNPKGVYPYWGRVGGESNLLRTLVTMPIHIFEPAAKPVLLLALLGVVAGAAARSPLLLIAVPTLIWRLASENPLYWSTGPVHYNAILMPIVFVALIDAVPRLLGSSRAAFRAYGRLAAPVAGVVAVALLTQFPLGSLATPGFYDKPARAEGAANIIRHIPDGARVAVSNYLAPQLTDRAHVILFPRFTERDPVDWVLVDTSRMDGVPAPRQEQEAALNALPARGFRKVAEQRGVVLYRRA